MTALQPSETQFQQAVFDLLDLYRWKYVHFHDSRRSVGAGWPDLFCVHPRGHILVAELKKHDGRVSPAQQGWIDAFAAAGIPVHVWRPADLPTTIVRALSLPGRPVAAAATR